MIEPRQLLVHIIRPVLKDMLLWSEPAERLILGTACVESECGRWLVQNGGGPALGIYQMEPATHQDIYFNFLSARIDLRRKLADYELNGDADEMIGNLCYATAMCRIHYLRVKEAIPDYLAGQAAYWKRYYNTEDGDGTVAEYMSAWNQFVTPAVLAGS